MLEHGGRLRVAAQQYVIPLTDWIDLSTGLNPHAWPVPERLPLAVWQRLPEEQDGLEAAACAYYAAPALLPVAGSQAAIQALPGLRSHSRVGILAPAYAEHAYAWRQAQHQVLDISAEQIEAQLDHLEVLVLVNPCNPTGIRFAPEQLLQWWMRLQARGGWLVVDEAFMDTTPELSLAAHTQQPGLIVLRSLGKFFGLAGIRVGFVLAATSLLTQLREVLGPWTVSGPARWVAEHALCDSHWQQQTRQRLLSDGRHLAALLSAHGLAPTSGTALFQWWQHAHALQVHEQLAQQAILTRYFAQPSSLRFGLPANQSDWLRLQTALQQLAGTGLTF